jgi:branched-chain amino acid transport system substrate-binding protein
MYGRFAPPVSSISESVYEALHLYARAARRARADNLAATARELHSIRHDAFPRGDVAVDGPETFRQSLFVAEARPGGFSVSRAS